MITTQGEISLKTSTIAETLLNIGEVVLEVSCAYVITRVWERPGGEIPTSQQEGIVKGCRELITECFRTGENQIKADHFLPGDASWSYNVRILPIHPDKDHLFVVTERRATRPVTELVEDRWRLALDAAGDGMWDFDMESGNVFFSDKWHEVFGYSLSEISTAEDWKKKVHPADRSRSQAIFERYAAGEVSHYTTEARYLCKDGTYKWILSRGVFVSRTEDGKPLRFIGTHSDINDLKVAEERHASMAQLLSNLIDNIQTGILVTDENNKIVYANRMLYEIYGDVGDPSEVLDTDMWERLDKTKDHYLLPDQFYSQTRDIRVKREMVKDEEWELKDGRILSRDYIPLLLGMNYQGEIWKFRDITEQRNAEKRIERLRLFYEQILNSFSVDILVFDPEARFLFVNPSAVKDEELRKWMLGKTDEDYCIHVKRPLSIAARRREIYDTVRREKKMIEWEERTDAADGSIQYYLRRMYPLYNDEGALEMMIAYGFEITEQVLSRDALKTSMDTFESAFKYSGIGVGLVSPDGKWLDVNKEICDITGYTKEELLQLRFQDITYPADIDVDMDLVRKMLRKEITMYTLEKRYVSKKNKIVMVLLTVSLVWNSDDSPRFFIAQVVDITKQKQLEDEIRRKNADLEAVRISLVNKISQLEELSHIIAHNMRGPVGNIQMLVRAAIATEGDDSEALSGLFSTHESLQMIGESTDSLLNTLDVLLELSNIKLNKSISYDECDFAEIIAEIMRQLHAVIHEKQAVIELALEVNHLSYPKIYLESILYNFISNALKYCKPDVPPKIVVSTRKADGKTILSIKDNGLGIDMHKYGHRLFKLNQVFHTGYDSKGVGLFITRSQIESLGGSVEVVSAKDEGSEFIVTF